MWPSRLSWESLCMHWLDRREQRTYIYSEWEQLSNIFVRILIGFNLKLKSPLPQKIPSLLGNFVMFWVFQWTSIGSKDGKSIEEAGGNEHQFWFDWQLHCLGRIYVELGHRADLSFHNVGGKIFLEKISQDRPEYDPFESKKEGTDEEEKIQQISSFYN